MEQPDIFIDQYTEDQKLSAEFFALQSVYGFEYEFIETEEYKRLVITSKEKAIISFQSARKEDLNFFYQMANKIIPITLQP